MLSLVKPSIILTTYNRKDALRLVLFGLNDQVQLPFEVIVADDGSNEQTSQLLQTLQSQLNYPLKHVWHEDKGFRAAAIRNQAVLKAQGNYLIFLDGDCIPFRDFVFWHQRLAEAGYFVSGHRILLSEKFTQQLLTLPQNTPIYQYSASQWFKLGLIGASNQLFPLLRLNKYFRKQHLQRWKGVKTCNLGMWKKDFIAVNGFDESFTGWGYEDSDLVIRLLRNGILRKSGKFAIPVIHLWHPENDRQFQTRNLKLLDAALKTSSIRTKNGLMQE